MPLSLPELQERRRKLQAALHEVEQAIATFGEATAVQLRTEMSLRLTFWVVTEPTGRKDLLQVFKDQGLSVYANPADRCGWVSKTAWEQFKSVRPEMIGRDIWAEEE